MKVAVLSESSGDEAALRILAEAVLGIETTPTESPPLRSRGWPAVRNVLPAVILHLHYRTDAGGLVVVVDSDDTPPHRPDHDVTAEPRCRLCEIRATAARVTDRLRPRPHAPPLKLALGLATPAIEAWYAVAQSPHVTEAAWVHGLRDRQFPFTRRSLKQLVYGTDRPSIHLETERATAAARFLSTSLDRLESSFPNGFGPFARELRSWL